MRINEPGAGNRNQLRGRQRASAGRRDTAVQRVAFKPP
jgi:hypothetical protein